MDIITVYFFYGLSFFSMGLTVLLEVDRSLKLDFARALRPLAGFGLVHGTHEWLEMFLLIYPGLQSHPLYTHMGSARIILLAVSFFFLISFGVQLILGQARNTLHWKLLFTVAGLWLLGLLVVFATQTKPLQLPAADTYTRYTLAIPGAALTAWGLVLQQQKFFRAGMKNFGRVVVIAAMAFGLYGGVGQLFVAQSPIFPSQYINSALFAAWFGFPVQLFRSVMACVAAVAMISSLRVFDESMRRQIDELREAQLEERKRVEELHSELLRRTVRAQESERQRIARELHDELGQTLTALGLGLRAIATGVALRPERVKEQARELQALVDDGFTGLQNLISGLHPPQLDDFGLNAALRWYGSEIKERYGLAVDISSQGEEQDLPIEIRVVLYRIIQEALTNVIRHAETNQAKIQITYSASRVEICVEDHGRGFDVEATLNRQPGYPCWGLLGMIERASLVRGECRITSNLGRGTTIQVSVPTQES